MSEWFASTASEIAQWLFGEHHSQPGEGLDAALEPGWTWPAWLMLTLFVCFAASVFWIYRREKSPASRGLRIAMLGLRCAALVTLLFMLQGFVLRQYRTQLPDLAVLIDVSASMGHADPLDSVQETKRLSERIKSAQLSGSTRLNLAKMLLLEKDAALLKKLSQRYNVRLYFVGEAGRESEANRDELPFVLKDLSASDRTSRLGDSLLQVVDAQRGRPTAAMVLLSDGVTTEGESLAEAARHPRRKAWPVFAIGMGSDKPQRDIELVSANVGDRVYLGDTVKFDLRIAQHGYDGQPLVVRLWEIEGNRRIERQKQQAVFPANGQPLEISLFHRATRKQRANYLVEVEPQLGETRTDNNSAERSVDIHDDKIRVLYVQDYPSWEFRYLRNYLGRTRLLAAKAAAGENGKPVGPGEQVAKVGSRGDNPIELTTVLRDADKAYVQSDPLESKEGFPVDPKTLSSYDVFIIGDVNPAFLNSTEMNSLVSLVKQEGKGIVFIGGPRYMPMAYRGTPLEELFPVQLAAVETPDPKRLLDQPLSVRLSRLGQSSALMQVAASSEENARVWQNLPPLYFLVSAPGVKPGAQVLAEDHSQPLRDGAPLPLICLQYVGAGKVVFHATDETFRWRGANEDAVFGRYWLQMIYYLSQGKLAKNSPARLTSESREYQQGESVRLNLQYRDDRLAPADDRGVTVVVKARDGARRQFSMRRTGGRGTFNVSIPGLPQGEYQAWVASTVGRDSGKADDLDSDEKSPSTPTTHFRIVAPAGEMIRLAMDRRELQKLATATRGEFLALANADRLLSLLPEGKEVRTDAMSPMPIWNSWKLGVLLVGLLVTEWILRKRVGLL